MLTQNPNVPEPSGPTVAIIGAGAAGLIAARTLADAGLSVTLIDKSRGLGGRLATRRREDFAFDHGCPSLTVSDPADRALMAELVKAGAAVDQGDVYLGMPGMSALLKPLADGLDLQRGVRIAQVLRDPQGWKLRAENAQEAEFGPFDWLLVAAPAPQAAALLDGQADMVSQISKARMAPRWTLMVVPDGDLGQAGEKMWFEDEILDFAVRNDTKPGRVGPESWVVHARQDWSASNLEIDADSARDRLLAAFRSHVRQGHPRYVTAHRWRYAEVEDPLDAPCLIDPILRLAAGGDWCLGPLVTDALASGRSMAEQVLASARMVAQ
jgi:hypothetical protein